MWDGINLLASNLNFGFDTLVFMIILMGCLVFYIEDFRKGVIVTFVIMLGTFMWFYQQDYNWANPLIAALIALVVLSFTLYSSVRQGAGVY